MAQFMTNHRYALLAYGNSGLTCLTFESMEELLPIIMSRYSLDKDNNLDKLQEFIDKIMLAFREEAADEEREHDFLNRL